MTANLSSSNWSIFLLRSKIKQLLIAQLLKLTTNSSSLVSTLPPVKFFQKFKEVHYIFFNLFTIQHIFQTYCAKVKQHRNTIIIVTNDSRVLSIPVCYQYGHIFTEEKSLSIITKLQTVISNERTSPINNRQMANKLY